MNRTKQWMSTTYTESINIFSFNIHTHTHTHSHTRMHTHTYTHALQFFTEIHVCLQNSFVQLQFNTIDCMYILQYSIIKLLLAAYFTMYICNGNCVVYSLLRLLNSCYRHCQTSNLVYVSTHINMTLLPSKHCIEGNFGRENLWCIWRFATAFNPQITRSTSD